MTKQILLDLDDKRIGVLSEVLSNKTAMKIINYLAENEASETEIARDLKIPANTVNYNVKKLKESGLIEKTKDYFWSVKGKKILKYKVANKKIIISPKSKSKITNGFLALIGTAGVGFVLQRFFMSSSSNINPSDLNIEEKAAAARKKAIEKIRNGTNSSDKPVGIDPKVMDDAKKHRLYHSKITGEELK